MKRTIIILLIMGLTHTARADYHYASHQGSNEYPYTSWATAADSIQNAVDAASPHDTVYIGAGDWYESVAVEYYDSVAIVGMGIDSTFWYSDEYATDILMLDYGCSVEKITFQHLNNFICVHSRAYAGVKIKNCRFLHSHRGIQVVGGPTEISNCIIDSCESGMSAELWLGDYIISNNLITNTYGFEAMNMDVNDAIIQNNIVINMDSVSVWSLISSGLFGNRIVRNNIFMNGYSSTWIYAKQYNNTYYNFISPNYPAISGFDGDSIYNNNVVDCKVPILLEHACHVNYNNFWNYENDPPTQLFINPVGNISADPMHVSSTDVHLQAFSPLIDAGDPNVLDLDGSRSDIGAYGGPHGETYTYLDLPPAVPDSLTGEMVGDTIFLVWRYNTEADFDRYYVHRDSIPGFTPSSFNLIAEPETSYYADTDFIPGTDYYYKISAVDNQANMSGYSEELEVLNTGIWDGMGVEPPRITSIKANYPNPFNSKTTIIYYVANLGPIPAQINIDIYDILGRQVRTLVDERKEVGLHRAGWDGRDDGGNNCPSGVYFARITQWHVDYLNRYKKIMLLR